MKEMKEKLLKNFDIRNIKTGMLVRTRDTNLRIVIGNTMIAFDNGGGLILNKYKKNMTWNELQRDSYDIMEIYDEPMKNDGAYGLAADLKFWLDEENFLKYSSLIWKREE